MAMTTAHLALISWQDSIKTAMARMDLQGELALVQGRQDADLTVLYTGDRDEAQQVQRELQHYGHVRVTQKATGTEFAVMVKGTPRAAAEGIFEGTLWRVYD